MTPWELTAMRYLLDGGDQMTMREICKGIILYNPGVYRVKIINGMVAKGWLRRRADVLEATAKGCIALKDSETPAVLRP